VGQSLQLSQGAVNNYVARARRAGLTWPLPEGLDDARLEQLLFPLPAVVVGEERPVPEGRNAFGYSWFCQVYREWLGRLTPSLRQVHTAGERVFVAGHIMEVIDWSTGEIRKAEIFVAVFGASNYTFAEATWTQSLPDWIAVHVNMLTLLGSVPRQIVCDNRCHLCQNTPSWSHHFGRGHRRCRCQQPWPTQECVVN
jgi:transposase